ncbi:hypothetical protein [Citrifermentans bremense]|uniref:hypothetical protein n=1 Tax=Citrifermentans bremense TaxID=60035 RepID=UPI0018D9E718|nr:hypothetical protein [Citrifermentans bremense]
MRLNPKPSQRGGKQLLERYGKVGDILAEMEEKLTYALVDNATLTAVQRILGQVKTKSRDSVDTDIVALENFLQAVLFYDQIIAIDDYIPRHRDARIKSFNFVNFLRSADYNLDALAAKASEKSAELRPEIRGGEFVNEDFKRLLELLQTHIICTWDVSSSIYYLTLKGLAEKNSEEFEKYGNLAAAIFSELGDAADSGKRTSGDVALFDRYGQPIGSGYKIPGAKWGDGSTGGMTGAIKPFVASLVWLANRSIFYSLVAKYLQADTFLYPIRQAYQQHYISQSCNYGQNYPKRIVESFSSTFSEDIIAIQQGGLATASAIDLPIFGAWMARQTGDPATLITATLELRERSEFQEAREQLREVRRLFDESDIGSANKAVTKIIVDLKKASTDMRTKYGIKTKQGVPVTRLVHIYNTVAALKGLPTLPDYNFSVKLPDFLKFDKNRGFSSVYRNLTHDLSTTWSLGEARDILGSRVILDKEAFVYNPKNEDPIYRKSHSPIKSPM